MREVGVAAPSTYSSAITGFASADILENKVVASIG
jgi:hypothetical protein